MRKVAGSFKVVGVGLAMLAALPAVGSAQPTSGGVITEYVSQEKAPGATDQAPQGFAGGFTLGATLNLANNRYMVGQVDGTSVLMGVSGLGTARYRKDKHEWRANLSIAETWARTSVLPEFVKSNDVLDLENLYNYYLASWMGPFARVAMQTSVLPTKRVTASDQTYIADGATTGAITTDRFELASSFQPFTLTESLGWFLQPINTVPLTIYSRAGVGGRHTFADGSRLITDDKDATAIRYVDLQNVHQAGVEVFAGFDGKVQEGRVQYSAGASALFPFLNNDSANRSVGQLTRIAGQGSLGVGVFSWMSLNYLVKVIRDTQLIDRIQVQNSLLLTVSLSVSTEKPAAPPVDPAIAALEARIAAAEARAAEAEQRATAAEKATGETTAPPAPAAPSPTNP